MNINNKITATYSILAAKNRTTPNLLDIYFKFFVYHNGIPVINPFKIASGLSIKGYYRKGTITGENAKADNTNLITLKGRINDLISNLTAKGMQTAAQMKLELLTNAKLSLTGKAPLQTQKAYFSRLHTHTIKAITTAYLNEKSIKPGSSRERNYKRIATLFNEALDGNTPTLDQLTADHLLAVKQHITAICRTKNAAVTYLAMVNALLNFAAEKEIITKNPAPKKYKESFIRAEREVLNEAEILQFQNSSEYGLTNTRLKTKYTAMVMLLTGIAYCDLKGLQPNDLKYDENNDQYYITKNRSKTQVKFTVNLTANALNYVRKLQALTGNDTNLFNLPSIEFFSLQLKNLMKKSGIKKNVSSYTLRHSFAQIFMENDGKIEDLKVRLGHTSINTTQIYGIINSKRNAAKTRQLEHNSPVHKIQKNWLKVV